MTKTPLSGFPCEASRWREGSPPVSGRRGVASFRCGSGNLAHEPHLGRIPSFAMLIMPWHLWVPPLLCAADMTLRGAHARMEDFLDMGRAPTIEEQDEQVCPS